MHAGTTSDLLGRFFFFLADGSKACGEGELELVCVKAQRGLDAPRQNGDHRGCKLRCQGQNVGARSRVCVSV